MEANNGRRYPKPRKRTKRKARPALESKERATVPRKQVIIIPRDLPDLLFGLFCLALFLGLPAHLSLVLNAAAS